MLLYVNLLVFSLITASYASADGHSCAQIKASDFERIVDLSISEKSNFDDWRNLAERAQSSQKNCQKEQPNRVGCFSNVTKFLDNQKFIHSKGHSYRFRISDKEYISSRPDGVVSLPPEFADGLPKNWKEVCVQNGWKYLEYASNIIVNPPNLSFKRVLVLVPGSTFERWIQFTVPEGDSNERLIDVIGVEHSVNEDGKLVQLQKVKLNFIEYWRDGQGKNPQVREKMASCFKCHAGGMRKLIPAYGSVSDEGLSVLKEFNSKIAAYQHFDFAGAVAPELGGPPMGAKQNCTACHNGISRGAFTAHHMGIRSRQQLYYKMVESLQMPPSLRTREDYKPLFATLAKADSLSEDVRAELYGQSYFTRLIQTMRGLMGRERGQVAVPLSKILDFLRDKNVIDEREHKNSKEILKRAQAEQEKKFKELKSDYKSELINWLKGDSEDCQPLFKD